MWYPQIHIIESDLLVNWSAFTHLVSICEAQKTTFPWQRPVNQAVYYYCFSAAGAYQLELPAGKYYSPSIDQAPSGLCYVNSPQHQSHQYLHSHFVLGLVLILVALQPAGILHLYPLLMHPVFGPSAMLYHSLSVKAILGWTFNISIAMIEIGTRVCFSPWKAQGVE